MKPALLLVSDRTEDLEFVTEVSIHGGFELRVYSDLAEAFQALDPERLPLLFVDIALPGRFEEFVRVFSPKFGKEKGKLDPNLIHLIGPEEISQVDPLKSAGFFGHYVSQNYGDAKIAGKYYSRIARREATGPPDGLAQLLSPDAVIQEFELKHSDQKEECLERIDSFLRTGADVSSWLIPQVVTAADELLMNAIFDAPLDKSGDQEHKALARSAPVALAEGQSIVIEMGYDGVYLAVTVTDCVGSLNKPKLLKHLFSGKPFEHFIVDPNVAGAGIGLATTYRTGGSLIFVNHPGKRTRVTAFFKQCKSRLEYRKKLHFISIHVVAG